jgi:hypothetical protein
MHVTQALIVIDMLFHNPVVEHVIFCYTSSPISKDTKKMIEISKQLAKFAR